MTSTSTETRLNQKEKAKEAAESRRALLAEKGIVDKAAKRDPLLRKLEAKLKKANKQLAAIEARALHVKEIAEQIRIQREQPSTAAAEKPSKKAAKAKAKDDSDGESGEKPSKKAAKAKGESGGESDEKPSKKAAKAKGESGGESGGKPGKKSAD